MYTNMLLTIWMLIHFFTSWTGIGFSNVHAGEINVARTASCNASSGASTCKDALDDSTKTRYASVGEGVGLWYRLDLAHTYNVTRLLFIDSFYYHSRNKDLRLSFGDGSTQEVTLLERGTGFFHLDVPISPVWTNSILIEVVSVYTTRDNGFYVIQVFADPDNIEVDECALKTDNCDANARCENTLGSYTCTCFPFFKGDGFTCIAKSCQKYTISGNFATPQEKKVAIRLDKQCLVKCANTEGCVASLQHVTTGKCTLYYKETDADKAQYGEGYIMWRAKKP